MQARSPRSWASSEKHPASLAQEQESFGKKAIQRILDETFFNNKVFI